MHKSVEKPRRTLAGKRIKLPPGWTPNEPLPNVRHEVFARNVAQGMAYSAAYIGAGFRKPKGYPDDPRAKHSVASAAAELAREEALMARVRAIQALEASKVQLTTDILFDMLVEQATFDPALFADVDSPEALVARVPEKYRRLLVQGWSWDRSGRFRLDLVRKTDALDRLARNLAFYAPDIEVKVNFADMLVEARDRMRGQARVDEARELARDRARAKGRAVAPEAPTPRRLDALLRRLSPPADGEPDVQDAEIIEDEDRDDI